MIIVCAVNDNNIIDGIDKGHNYFVETYVICPLCGIDMRNGNSAVELPIS